MASAPLQGGVVEHDEHLVALLAGDEVEHAVGRGLGDEAVAVAVDEHEPAGQECLVDVVEADVEQPQPVVVAGHLGADLGAEVEGVAA